MNACSSNSLPSKFHDAIQSRITLLIGLQTGQYSNENGLFAIMSGHKIVIHLASLWPANASHFLHQWPNISALVSCWPANSFHSAFSLASLNDRGKNVAKSFSSSNHLLTSQKVDKQNYSIIVACVAHD